MERSISSGVSFGQDSYVFAGVFQFFFIRLAVFFGCLGIFMNLFRGEMLDKSLHFYLLAPIRREILLIGKYLAGLLAAERHFHNQRRVADRRDVVSVRRQYHQSLSVSG